MCARNVFSLLDKKRKLSEVCGGRRSEENCLHCVMRTYSFFRWIWSRVILVWYVYRRTNTVIYHKKKNMLSGIKFV